MTNAKNLIIRILEITNYLGDKEEFATDFLEHTQRDSLILILNSLSEEKQSSIKLILDANPSDYSPLNEIIQSQFTEAELDYFFDSSLRQNLTNYLQPMLASLTKSQQDKLIAEIDASFPKTPHLDSQPN